MRIQQITSPVVCGPKYVGKWWCSETLPVGSDGYPVHRYLNSNSVWGKNTEYFDSREQIENLLVRAGQPDFTLDTNELRNRAMLRDWIDDESAYDDVPGFDDGQGYPTDDYSESFG